MLASSLSSAANLPSKRGCSLRATDHRGSQRHEKSQSVPRPWPTARACCVTRHPRVVVSSSAGAPKKKGRMAPVCSSAERVGSALSSSEVRQSHAPSGSTTHRWPSTTASPGPASGPLNRQAATGRSRGPAACRAGQTSHGAQRPVNLGRSSHQRRTAWATACRHDAFWVSNVPSARRSAGSVLRRGRCC